MDAQEAGVGTDGSEGNADAAAVDDTNKLPDLRLHSLSRSEDTEQTTDDTKDDSKPKRTPPPDPIRMFGFNVPTPLRNSQADSIRNLDIISKLASLSVNMQALEIQVRRTQKRRNKALASETSLEVSKEQLDPQTLPESARREAIVAK